MNFLDLFNSTFVNYYDFKVPMYANWNYKEDELRIKVAIPGYEKEDFTLSVYDNELRLKVKLEKGERTYSIITRHWDAEYDLNKAKATYKNGILIISIPKDKKAKALKQIEIS